MVRNMEVVPCFLHGSLRDALDRNKLTSGVQHPCFFIENRVLGRGRGGESGLSRGMHGVRGASLRVSP